MSGKPAVRTPPASAGSHLLSSRSAEYCSWAIPWTRTIAAIALFSVDDVITRARPYHEPLDHRQQYPCRAMIRERSSLARCWCSTRSSTPCPTFPPLGQRRRTDDFIAAEPDLAALFSAGIPEGATFEGGVYGGQRRPAPQRHLLSRQGPGRPADRAGPRRPSLSDRRRMGPTRPIIGSASTRTPTAGSVSRIARSPFPSWDRDAADSSSLMASCALSVSGWSRPSTRSMVRQQLAVQPQRLPRVPHRRSRPRCCCGS